MICMKFIFKGNEIRGHIQSQWRISDGLSTISIPVSVNIFGILLKIEFMSRIGNAKCLL